MLGVLPGDCRSVDLRRIRREGEGEGTRPDRRRAGGTEQLYGPSDQRAGKDVDP